MAAIAHTDIAATAKGVATKERSIGLLGTGMSSRGSR
jgi:hypothetical protein